MTLYWVCFDTGRLQEQDGVGGMLQCFCNVSSDISLGKAGEFVCYFYFTAYQVDYKSRITWEDDTVEH